MREKTVPNRGAPPVWCLGFRVWCLVFGVWCLGFGICCLGFVVWDLVFGVWCLVFGICCLLFGVWCLGFVFGVWYLLSSVWCLMFGVWCLVFGVWDLVFGVEGFGRWPCVHAPSDQVSRLTLLSRIARGQTDLFNSGTNSKIGTSRVQIVGARLPIWNASEKLPDPFALSLSKHGHMMRRFRALSPCRDNVDL
ncbi:hypothetical protein T484DRAFT_2773965 [Baffinella frigidus]|nr:hypothetical protein T484DRAFT_2773965 [Cryptophyta sp. CCMP2293]